MADFLFKAIPPEIVGRLDAEKPLAAQAFQEVGRRFQYNEEGGAPLLGIDGTCIICHGSSDSRAIRNALRGSAKLTARDINSQIVEQLQEPAIAGQE